MLLKFLILAFPVIAGIICLFTLRRANMRGLAALFNALALVVAVAVLLKDPSQGWQIFWTIVSFMTSAAAAIFYLDEPANSDSPYF